MGKGRATYVALAFALLLIILPFCLPALHTEWLYRHWMWLGLLGLFPLCTALATQPRQPLLLIALGYLLHQFEEHGIDATGQVYALAPLMEARSGLTFLPSLIYQANASFLWPLITAALLMGTTSMPAQILAGIALMNGIAHILAAFMLGSYNPGLASALLILLPAAVWYWRTVKDASLPLGLGIALGVHVAIFASAAALS